MRLTQKQETMVSRYVAGVARTLDGDLPQKQRERSLLRLERRIWQALEDLHLDEVEDADVERVLARVNARETEAPHAAPPSPESAGLFLPVYNRVWLGVCAGIATRMGWEPRMVRAAAVGLGVLTGPLAIIGYLAAYTVLYLASGPQVSPRVNGWRVVIRGGVAFLATIALHLVALYIIRGLEWAVNRFLAEPTIEPGQWGWFEANMESYFLYALVLAVPFGILSGLPLANAWDRSLKRVAQAILALYAMLICFGLASLIVGIILDAVEEFAGWKAPV